MSGQPMARLRSDALQESWALRNKAQARRVAAIRLPVEPLIEECNRRWRPYDCGALHNATDYGKLGSVLNYDRKTLFRWKRDGGLTLYAADKAAIELGLHPLNIWGDLWLEAC